MREYLTKKYLDESLSKYQAAILDAVDSKFLKVDSKFEEIDSRFDKVDSKFEEIDSRFDKVDSKFEEIDSRFAQVDFRFTQVDKRLEEAKEERLELKELSNKLLNTLDAFLKRLVDFEDEFTILKAEVSQIKKVFKKKFGVDISL